MKPFTSISVIPGVSACISCYYFSCFFLGFCFGMISVSLLKCFGRVSKSLFWRRDNTRSHCVISLKGCLTSHKEQPSACPLTVDVTEERY